jgi:predicted deacetylase
MLESPMPEELSDLEVAAQRCEFAAQELERAALHLRTSAQHFRKHEVPRACAHLFAAQGHMLETQTVINEQAVVHAAKSNP